MDVTSLCITTLMVMIVLLVVQVTQSDFVQNAGEAFQPNITPDRLQFFFYEKINITCEQVMGLTEWRVIQKPFTKVQTSVHSYNQSAQAYKISTALDSHSGKYWCENGDGETSNAINITVTDGDVILDVPASPVLEGHDVSLFCRHRRSKIQGVAEFYKDDSPLETAYDRKLTIRNVSKSDEGLYKCSIKDAESPESWLSVIKMGNKFDPEIHSPDQHVSHPPPQQFSHPPPQQFSHPPPQQISHPPIFLWIVRSTILTVLLLLVLGLFLCQTHKVSAECSEADLHQDTRTIVRKMRKKKGPNSSGRQKHSSLEDGDIYSAIKPN